MPDILASSEQDQNNLYFQGGEMPLGNFKKILLTFALLLVIGCSIKIVLAEKIAPPNFIDVKVDGKIVDQKNLKIDQAKTIYFEGTAAPNSNIYLYFYSKSPMLSQVKTDDKGNWSYTLTQQLSVGSHKLMAETHLDKEISANVELLKFSITRGNLPVVSEISNTNLIWIIVGIVIVGLLIWLFIQRRKT